MNKSMVLLFLIYILFNLNKVSESYDLIQNMNI